MKKMIKTTKTTSKDEKYYVAISCSICEKEHEELVIDNHISQSHICDKCVRKIIKEWLKES